MLRADMSCWWRNLALWQPILRLISGGGQEF